MFITAARQKRPDGLRQEPQYQISVLLVIHQVVSWNESSIPEFLAVLYFAKNHGNPEGSRLGLISLVGWLLPAVSRSGISLIRLYKGHWANYRGLIIIIRRGGQCPFLGRQWWNVANTTNKYYLQQQEGQLCGNRASTGHRTVLLKYDATQLNGL